MKKDYSKPDLNTKAYAQFENVFTACDKNKNSSGNAGAPCSPGSVSTPSTMPDTSSEFVDNKSN